MHCAMLHVVSRSASCVHCFRAQKKQPLVLAYIDERAGCSNLRREMCPSTRRASCFHTTLAAAVFCQNIFVSIGIIFTKIEIPSEVENRAP